MSSSEDIVKDVCGWVGSAISMFFYLSPIVPIIKLIKKEITVKEIPCLIFISSLLNTLLWCVYGFHLDEMPSWLSNGIGGLVQVVWLMIYWVYFAEKQWLPSILYNFIMINFIVEIFYLCYYVAGKENMEVIGYIAMVFNILMYASPGIKLYQVFKTSNHKLISIESSICGIFSSAFWGIYGFILGKVSLVVPNGIGFLLSVLQIIVWAVYYHKYKKNLKKEEGHVDIENQESQPTESNPTTPPQMIETPTEQQQENCNQEGNAVSGPVVYQSQA